MDFAHAKADRVKVEEFLQRHRIGFVTLLFTDMVGSTKLKQTLGDVPATVRIHEHHAALRELLQGFNEAQEISTAGDSFFIAFARPSDAVKFSLLLQSRLRHFAHETGVPLLDRICIHVGEVIIAETQIRDEDARSNAELVGILLPRRFDKKDSDTAHEIVDCAVKARKRKPNLLTTPPPPAAT